MKVDRKSEQRSTNAILQAEEMSQPRQWMVEGVIVAQCDTAQEAIDLYRASRAQSTEPDPIEHE